MEYQVVLSIQTALTFMMVGVMWFMQIVHYPLYKKIKEGFGDYERTYLRRSSLLLAPLMLGEAVTALLLIGLTKSSVTTRLAALNLIFLTIIWIATLLFQVVQQQKLAVRFSAHIHHALLGTNWIRVTLWSLRGLILIALLFIE